MAGYPMITQRHRDERVPSPEKPGFRVLYFLCVLYAMKLDNDHIEKLLANIRNGMAKKIACIAAGISTSTYYAWVKQGKEDEKQGVDSLQRQLHEALPQAEALSELEYLKIIKAAKRKDWRACAWYLERSRPERYGRRTVPPEQRERDELIVIG